SVNTPVIDGDLSDPCWQDIKAVSSFWNVKKQVIAEKQTAVKACFDKEFIYFAFAAEDDELTGVEVERDRKEIWKNDCIEIFLSAESDAEKERHFVLGVKNTYWDGCPALGGIDWKCEWSGKVKETDFGYTAEVKIPLSAMVDAKKYDVQKGVKWSLKITRMNKNSKSKTLSSLTPISGSTADKKNLAQLVFVDENLLGNAEFGKINDAGKPAGWHFRVRDLETRKDVSPDYKFELQNKELTFAADFKKYMYEIYPGTMEGMLKIPRQPVSVTYRFSFEAKWESEDKLTDRPRPSAYFPTKGKYAKLLPDEKWHKYAIDYQVPKDKREINVKMQGARISGKLSFRNLSLKAVSDANYFDKFGLGIANLDGVINLKPGRGVTLEKVEAVDCRTLTAFIHNPADGRTDSRGYSNNRLEYPFTSGGYARFDAYDNPPLHVKLADNKGFDAILMRGDFRGKLYSGAGLLEPGEKAKAVCDIDSKSNVFRTILKKRAENQKISFFRTSKSGEIADVAFLRLSYEDKFNIDDSENLTVAKSDGKISEIIGPWLKKRFNAENLFYQAGDQGSAEILLELGKFTQITTKPLKMQAVAALTCELDISEVAERGLLTIRVQDPLNPRRELIAGDFSVSKPGNYKVTFDFADQVLFSDKDFAEADLIYRKGLKDKNIFWLTLASGMKIKIKSMKLSFHKAELEKAVPETLALRKFLLTGYFAAMSEPRPWTILRKGMDIEKFIATHKSGTYEAGLQQIFETIEMCRMLDPEDNYFRQYYEWIFRRLIDIKQAKPDLSAYGKAPRWAALAHRAWQATSYVPRWWLGNRLLPSGEMGGTVQDDTDFYQQMPLYHMIEDKPLGSKIKKATAALNNLAWKVNLHKGINKKRTDVLHAYEEGMNHISTSLLWHYGDPVFFERGMQSADSAMQLTIVGPDGKKYFTRETIAAPDIGKVPEKITGEGMYHSLYTQPIYEVALYNKNPKAMEFLTDYVTTRIAFHSKGNYPTGYNKDNTGKTWQISNRPGAYYTGEPWLGLHQITRDAKYLEPYRIAFEDNFMHFRIWKRWCKLSQVPEFKDLIMERFKDKKMVMSGYNGFLLTGDKKMLEDDLEKTINEYEYFPHMYTSCEPFTDRVLPTNLPPVFLCYLGTTSERNHWTHDPAVSYEGLGSDFAALVYPTARDHLKVALYNFKKENLQGSIRIWRLPNGIYKVKIGPDADDDGVLDSVTEETEVNLFKNAAIDINLKPEAMTLIDITPVKKLPSIFERADLAVSPYDTPAAGNNVKINIHNIGAKTAHNIKVNLVRGSKVVETKTVGSLEAPLDLKARIAVVEFNMTQAGDKVIVDPENSIAEINEENNFVSIADKK
ncbi:MAG: CARDB domain-containing protein, partial [Planctomycetota bacterium]